MGFPGTSVVKNLSANTGDEGLIPGLGRSPGEGNGNPLLAWGIPWTEEPGGDHKSWTGLSIQRKHLTGYKERNKSITLLKQTFQTCGLEFSLSCYFVNPITLAI